MVQTLPHSLVVPIVLYNKQITMNKHNIRSSVLTNPDWHNPLTLQLAAQSATNNSQFNSGAKTNGRFVETGTCALSWLQLTT